MARTDEFFINNVPISRDSPPFFIADIAANHDGDLGRAIDLIHLAAESGAHAAKFQHFSAKTLVSDFGFKSLGGKYSHQASWEKSVFEVYEDASISLDWTEKLSNAARDAGIAFMSTPYSIELADHIDPYVEAYKIGSGDVNYSELISHVASTGKPWLIATGAADLSEVRIAVQATGANGQGVLMQCNTNYTASPDNFHHINLRVLSTFREEFPGVVLGLSDHTLGHASVLGAIALGARVFEKHFTDDRERRGPDHGFSMTPVTWRDMVNYSTELHLALGDGVKRVEENELDTVILQRRCLRISTGLAAGTVLERRHLVALRPAPSDSISPNSMASLIGKTLSRDLSAGSHVTWADLAV